MKYTGAQNKAGALIHHRDKKQEQSKQPEPCIGWQDFQERGAGCPNPALGWDETQGINEELISLGAGAALAGAGMSLMP